MVTGLFAGIGGFEIAFESAGFPTKLLVEINPYARNVLRTRFSSADICEDIETLSSLPIETSVVTAGFPCQNLSMAGDKTGISGRKTGIVVKLFDLIEASNVSTVVVENVYFMLQLDKGDAMRWLVRQFEIRGYRWAYRVLDSSGFGLPQRRRRVYLVASRVLDPRGVLFADNDGESAEIQMPQQQRPLGFYWTEGRSGVGFAVDSIPPLKVGSSIGIPSTPAVLFPDGEVLVPSLRACERIQGFPIGWTDIQSTDQQHEKQRWRMLGNAVSVPVAKWVANCIKRPGTVLDFESYPIDLTKPQRWPDAAWNVGNGPMTVKASDQPISVARPSIALFRDENWKQLSERALAGFISRASSGGLRMPPWFLEALRRAHSARAKGPLTRAR